MARPSWCAVIKRSYCVPSQGCTADVPSIRRFGRSKKRWSQLICESHRHGAQWSVFSCSFFGFLRRLQANKLWCTPNKRPFASKCFFHEQLSLSLPRTSWLIFISVLFRAHKHRSMIGHLWRSKKRLWKLRIYIFPKFLSFSISRYVTWRSFIISSRTASMFSGTTAVFYHHLRLRASFGHDWIH